MSTYARKELSKHLDYTSETISKVSYNVSVALIMVIWGIGINDSAHFTLPLKISLVASVLSFLVGYGELYVTNKILKSDWETGDAETMESDFYLVNNFLWEIKVWTTIAACISFLWAIIDMI